MIDKKKAGYRWDRDSQIAEQYASDPPPDRRNAKTMRDYLEASRNEFQRRAGKYPPGTRRHQTFSRAVEQIEKALQKGDNELARRTPHYARTSQRVAGIIGFVSLVLSLFFFSESITGNIIGVSDITSNIIGIILFIIGVIGIYFNVKK